MSSNTWLNESIADFFLYQFPIIDFNLHWMKTIIWFFARFRRQKPFITFNLRIFLRIPFGSARSFAFFRYSVSGLYKHTQILPFGVHRFQFVANLPINFHHAPKGYQISTLIFITRSTSPYRQRIKSRLVRNFPSRAEQLIRLDFESGTQVSKRAKLIRRAASSKFPHRSPPPGNWARHRLLGDRKFAFFRAGADWKSPFVADLFLFSELLSGERRRDLVLLRDLWADRSRRRLRSRNFTLNGIAKVQFLNWEQFSYWTSLFISTLCSKRIWMF